MDIEWYREIINLGILVVIYRLFCVCLLDIDFNIYTWSNVQEVFLNYQGSREPDGRGGNTGINWSLIKLGDRNMVVPNATLSLYVIFLKLSFKVISDPII